MRCLRVMSAVRQATASRDTAELGANCAILGLNAVQEAAEMASQGKIDQATQRLQVVVVVGGGGGQGGVAKVE